MKRRRARQAAAAVVSAVLGLCLSGCASTTRFDPYGGRAPAPVESRPASPSTPVTPATPVPPAVITEPIPAPPAAQSEAVIPPVVANATSRVALLLPLRSEALGEAARAVRAGFMAAYEREPKTTVIDVVESGDAPKDVLAAYAAAAATHDVIVGPLSRSGVAALSQNARVTKPTIALTQPDGDPVTVPRLLVMGLSIEDESRQVANWVATEHPGARIAVLSTTVSWQRRAAKAFQAQAERQGLRANVIEMTAPGGYLDTTGMAQLAQKLKDERPQVLFAALDIAQARQLRTVIGSELPLYGTSQLNPLPLADWATAEPLPEMNGALLLDIPWQLQQDHPAVMVYPRPVAAPDVAGQKRSADLERLYALGIDAYRVAAQVTSNNIRFDLDGVTGKLQVQMGYGVPSFSRTELPATYRNGVIAPLAPVGNPR